jgi:hypothetical protein
MQEERRMQMPFKNFERELLANRSHYKKSCRTNQIIKK